MIVEPLIVTKPLRMCRSCGLEAYTDKDLELFIKNKNLPYGRTTLCKSCFNEQRIYRRATNDRVYLRCKYTSMIQRCYYPPYVSFHLYGGRGITVCDEWLNDPDVFINWALNNGWSRGLELDRIDGDGPYSPDNCRWSTKRKQQQNRRDITTFLKKGTRICCRCKIEKPLTEFHRDRYHPQGRTYVCKECRNQKETS